MLSSSYLAGLSDGLVELYSQLEADIIADMAKRLKRLSAVTDATEYQVKIFQEAGGLQDDINKWLSKYEPKAQKQLQSLFEEALQKSAAKDVAQLNKEGLSDSQQQIMDATVKKVAHQGIVTGSKKVKQDADNGFIKVFSSVQRATMTIASSASNDFVQQANRAYMKVASGAFDYNTALSDGIEELAKKGIDTVEYTDSGKQIKRSVEGMLRTNIMTGINQTATQVTLDNCDDLDCQLVEVSAHIGARPEHEAWQGKIYSLTPNHPKYPYFYDVCGYGTPTGICGINCRHSFYPYFEGTEPLYSKGQLDEYKDKTVTYRDADGNKTEMTVYEAEQKQRGFERKIRMYKRAVGGFEAAKDTENNVRYAYAKNKLYEWQTIANDFSVKTGLKRDYSREFAATKTGTQPRGSKKAFEKFVSIPRNDKVKSFEDVKSDNDLVDYFINIYHADTSLNVALLNKRNVQTFMGGFNEIMDLFPEARKYIKKIGMTNGGAASFGDDGALNFNRSVFQTKEDLIEYIKLGISEGYFRKGTTPRTLGKHECVHVFENILINESGTYKTQLEKDIAWNKSTYAQTILDEAYTFLKKHGETKSLQELLSDVSGYAATDPSDGLTECFIWCRKKTPVLSLPYQVKRITLERLNKINGRSK